MAGMVRCPSCHSMYKADKDNVCPKCGAYNRHYRGNDKVCYEQRECHENDARIRYTEENPKAERAALRVKKQTKQSAGAKLGGCLLSVVFWILMALVILSALLD